MCLREFAREQHFSIYCNNDKLKVLVKCCFFCELPYTVRVLSAHFRFINSPIQLLAIFDIILQYHVLVYSEKQPKQVIIIILLVSKQLIYCGNRMKEKLIGSRNIDRQKSNNRSNNTPCRLVSSRRRKINYIKPPFIIISYFILFISQIYYTGRTHAINYLYILIYLTFISSH